MTNNTNFLESSHDGDWRPQLLTSSFDQECEMPIGLKLTTDKEAASVRTCQWSQQAGSRSSMAADIPLAVVG
jgi:hypothetical protein